MSLLAHLEPHLRAVEPAATQALAYLLRPDEAAEAFLHLLDPAGVVPFHPLCITPEEQHDSAQPDLTIRDQEGRIRILVENKFEARLTVHQPVGYLKQLPADMVSALLFIVPSQRLPALWDELRRLCEESDIPLENKSSQGFLRWARSGRRTLAITSWTHVLDTLACACETEAYQCDIVQLRGLTKQKEVDDAFLPLGSDEVIGTDVPRRLLNYYALIQAIVETLDKEGVARPDTRLSSGYSYTGQYLYLREEYRLWLGVDLGSWKRWGRTPIWSEHDTADARSGLQGRMQYAQHVFRQAEASGNWLCLPIHLTTGVDRDRVVRDAVCQLRRIGQQLVDNFPDNTSSTEASE